MLYAGRVAQERRRVPLRGRSGGATHDRRMAEEYCPNPNDQRIAWAKAERLVAENWNAIEKAATSCSLRLSGQEIFSTSINRRWRKPGHEHQYTCIRSILCRARDPKGHFAEREVGPRVSFAEREVPQAKDIDPFEKYRQSNPERFEKLGTQAKLRRSLKSGLLSGFW